MIVTANWRPFSSVPFLPCAALCALGAAWLTAAVDAQQRPPRSAPVQAAVAELDVRVQQYLELRAALIRKLAPVTPTASAQAVAARQAALAAAIRAARAGARPGDLVPPAAAAQIRTLVIEDFKRRSAADERATFSEVPAAARPRVNQPYPANAALPTIPPLLLMSLPRLPDSLQYRFYGRHLVVLDGDAQIILDYIANVLPRG